MNGERASIAELVDRSLPKINELLRNLSTTEDRAMPAYCLGVVSALAWSEGVELPPAVFEQVAACTSIDEAAEVYRRYLLSRHLQLHVREHELLAQKQREGEGLV